MVTKLTRHYHQHWNFPLGKERGEGGKGEEGGESTAEAAAPMVGKATAGVAAAFTAAAMAPLAIPLPGSRVEDEEEEVPHLRKVRKSNNLFQSENFWICDLKKLFADSPPWVIRH